MSNKPLFKFKTEEEFLEEYGNNWGRKIKNKWNPMGSMDFLFNTIIEPKFNIDFLKVWMLIEDVVIYEGWQISRDMIKPVNKDEKFRSNRIELQD